MYKGKRILAMIPARAGSKGLPGKNIRPLRRRPLIAWTIEGALKSRYIDRVIVSTDSREIAAVSKKYGAEVPFLRPKALATDKAKTIDVILHLMDWAGRNDKSYEVIMLLQPTSPLRDPADIDRAVKLLFSKKAMAVVSVCETEDTPQLANILPKNGSMKGFLRPEARNKNRQQCSLFYRVNGAVFLAYCDYIKSQRGFFGGKTFAYIMPKERSVDIDDIFDFRFAEFLSKALISA